MTFYGGVGEHIPNGAMEIKCFVGHRKRRKVK